MSSTKSKSRLVFCESEPEVITISKRNLIIVECPEIVIAPRQSNQKIRMHKKGWVVPSKRKTSMFSIKNNKRR